MSKNRERIAIMRPFRDANFRNFKSGMYLPMRSHTLYIAIKTRAYLKLSPVMRTSPHTHKKEKHTERNGWNNISEDGWKEKKMIIKEREMDGINNLLAEGTSQAIN